MFNTLLLEDENSLAIKVTSYPTNSNSLINRETRVFHCKILQIFENLFHIITINQPIDSSTPPNPSQTFFSTGKIYIYIYISQEKAKDHKKRGSSFASPTWVIPIKFYSTCLHRTSISHLGSRPLRNAPFHAFPTCLCNTSHEQRGWPRTVA